MKLQGKTAVASRTPWITLTPLAASLLLALAGPAMATESAQTPQLVGNKPVASNVQLSPPAPKADGLVTVTWEYEDEDGDKENGTSVEWLLDGATVAGQSGSQYALPADSSGKSLQVRVTPQSAVPAYPAVGDVASSATVTIDPWDDFSRPSLDVEVPWAEADEFCKTMKPAARLPTVAELQTLFISKTSATEIGQVNYEMCDIHGWPLKNRCGGAADSFWASEANGSTTHKTVNMTNGIESYTMSNITYLHVACVR